MVFVFGFLVCGMPFFIRHSLSRKGTFSVHQPNQYFLLLFLPAFLDGRSGDIGICWVLELLIFMNNQNTLLKERVKSRK